MKQLYFVMTRDYLIGRKKAFKSKSRAISFARKMIEESLLWYDTQEREETPSYEHLLSSVDVFHVDEEMVGRVFVPEKKAYQYGKLPLNISIARGMICEL